MVSLVHAIVCGIGYCRVGVLVALVLFRHRSRLLHSIASDMGVGLMVTMLFAFIINLFFGISSKAGGKQAEALKCD